LDSLVSGVTAVDSFSKLAHAKADLSRHHLAASAKASFRFASRRLDTTVAGG
jgi:hypothetical protein